MSTTFHTLKNALLALSLVTVLAASARAAVIVDVHTAQGPNIFGSPSYLDWTENVTQALRAGLPLFGTPNTPAFYQDQSVFQPGEVVVSPFPSWEGQADPGTVFGPQYANELGSRVHWVVRIADDAGGQVDIVNGVRQFRPASAWRGVEDFTRNTYAEQSPSQPLRIGVDFGPDGLPGTLDDIVLTSGSGPVDEIYYFIPALGDAASSPSGGSTEQDELDAVVSSLQALAPFDVSYTFTYFGESNGTAVASVVPEPGTLVLAGLAVLGLVGIARRKK